MENGDSYTGEGMDSAWRSKFVSVGDTLFQCFFDPVSGALLDASVFEYDDTSFGYPVIKEQYLSDGGVTPFYFYSRLLSEEEKIDFESGTWQATTVICQSENHHISKSELLDESMAQWRLFRKQSQEESTLDITAQLDLKKEGYARLKISGDSEYNGTFKGSWYPLKHSILVVLDNKSALVGQVFTVYADSTAENPSGEFIRQYGQSRIESLDCYKTGYHVFDYYIYESEAIIFWGSEWTPDKLTLDVKTETEYVLYGVYNETYFNTDPFSDPNGYDKKNFKESDLVNLPFNGQVTVVFHEDSTVTVTHVSGEVEQSRYKVENGCVWFASEINVYQSKYAVGANPWYPDNVNESHIIQLYRLDIGFNTLSHQEDYCWSYCHTDENGTWVQEDYSVIYYRIYLKPNY